MQQLGEPAAYTWLTLSLAQEHLGVAPDTDYRLVALAAVGSDLIDKPLAWAYFYKRYRSAVLFAHTLLAYLTLCLLTACVFPHRWRYTLAFFGHALLDRLWLFPNTFYWPLRGWRFHVWGKQGGTTARPMSRLLGHLHPPPGTLGLGSWWSPGAGLVCLAPPTLPT